MAEAESDSAQVRLLSVEKTSISVIASRLSRSLDKYYVDKLKIASYGANVNKDKLNELDDQFISLFDCLKQSMSTVDEAVIFCCQVLQKLGYNKIDEFRKTAKGKDSFDYKIQYPKVDCILTVLEFLGSLGEPDLKNARSMICNHTKLASDRVKTREDLVYVLCNEIKGFTEDNITFVLEIAEVFNRRHMFDSYLKRRLAMRKKIEERMKQQAKMKALSGDVAKDGPQRTCPKEKYGVEEQTGQEEQSPPTSQSGDQLVSPVPVTGSLNNSVDHTTLSTIKTQTDYSYSVEVNTEIGPPQASETPQIVVATNNATKNTTRPTEAINVQKVMEIFQSDKESVEGKWYGLGQELRVDEELLATLGAKQRSDSFKLEEVLCEAGECSWDTFLEALNTLGLDQLAVRIKDHVHD